MIFDKTENMALYFDKLPQFARVTEEYEKFCAAPFEEGRIDIEKDVMWCNVSKYETKECAELKYESHKIYADVQVMFDGEENFGWAPFNECEITEDFKEGGDIAFMKNENGQIFSLKKGYFAVFFPDDAHAPCLRSENCDTAHKLVFKVKL